MTNENPEVQGPTLNAPPTLPPVADPPPTVGYCRACGLALTTATVRQAMGTLYCAEHIPLTAGTAASSGPASSNANDNPYAGASPYAAPPAPPVVHADVNPVLGFLLGLIPGVGAIYNGQYAKGLVHVILFGFLISVADSNTPLSNFAGFLIPVSVFYMAFEAYHTAKLRRAGQAVDEFSSIVPADKRSSAFPVVPVFLIAAGVLFLLINFEFVSFRYLLRLWPAGLILLGFFMLWDRLNSRSTGGFPDVQ